MPTTGPSEVAIEADVRLLARMRAGEDAAFDELVAACGHRMLAVARKMLPNEDDANDAVQDAFLSAFKNLANFDGRSQLNTWLHRITVNACLMKLRTRKRKPERSIEDFLPAFVEDGHQVKPSEAWQPDRLAGIESRESMQALVREKIHELPEAYRVVLMLRDFEDLSTEEAAEVLGTTPNAVKTRLHRARQALRTLLDPIMRTKEAQE